MAQRRIMECKFKGCIDLTRNQNGYCDKHAEEYEQSIGKAKRERNRIYDKRREKNISDFYHSKRWQGIRLVALQRDNYLCQDCLKEKKITEAEHVHHTYEVKDNWERRFDIDILVSLCQPCHNRRHGGKVNE